MGNGPQVGLLTIHLVLRSVYHFFSQSNAFNNKNASPTISNSQLIMLPNRNLKPICYQKKGQALQYFLAKLSVSVGNFKKHVKPFHMVKALYDLNSASLCWQNTQPFLYLLLTVSNTSLVSIAVSLVVVQQHWANCLLHFNLFFMFVYKAVFFGYC